MVSMTIMQSVRPVAIPPELNLTCPRVLTYVCTFVSVLHGYKVSPNLCRAILMRSFLLYLFGVLVFFSSLLCLAKSM